MEQQNQVYLKLSSILNVPIQIYEKDFSFIVNGKEFKTSRLISDLLSPVISRIHINDPTFDTFVINTNQNGDFSHILNLTNFKSVNIAEEEIPFFSEVIEALGSGSIEHHFENDNIEITSDNILNFIKKHEKLNKNNCELFSKEIEFVSSHFFELCEQQGEDMKELSISTLLRILNNDHLRLKSEDQLLKFINDLNSKNSKYSILYETVLFINVTSNSMKEFLSVFEVSEMTGGTWNELSKRLCKEIEKKQEQNESQREERYIEDDEESEAVIFEYAEDKVFKGIFNHFQEKTGGQIEKEINFTASSVFSDSFHPQNVASFENQNKVFRSGNSENNWICFDFKEHRVVPTHYTIKSRKCRPNDIHPRSWVVEGSADESSWETIDAESNCSYLNGRNLVHTFALNHPKTTKFRYIRMRCTGPDWSNTYYLMLDSFEIYGRLI